LLFLDTNCFHHSEIVDRSKFIKEVHKVLKKGDDYLLNCFSYKNEPVWNHLTEKQLISLFSGYFGINEIRHFLPLKVTSSSPISTRFG
jgi:hypothetical protein